jgi:ABC-type glycerol-3-phosphate transport system permease component
MEIRRNHRKSAIKDSKQLTVTKIIVFIIFAFYAISLIFPFVWMIFNSFKTNQEFFKDVWAWPNDIANGWTNFLTAMSMKKSGSTVLTMTLRSFYLAIIGTVLSLISASTISYVVAKYKFPGRNLIYLLAVIVMIVPSIGTTSATYQLIKDLNLFDNVLALVLMYSGGFGFQFLLLYSAFRSLSWTYVEAAYIDGAGDFTSFYKVMLPMVAPTLVPLAILDFIGFWNDYFTPYMYMKNHPTLAVGLQSMVSQMQYNANWPALFSLMLFSMVPVLIIFIAFQKQIMSNVTTGGLKG